MWYNCKSLYSESLKSEVQVDTKLAAKDIKLDSCDDCWTLYYYDYYTYDEYYDCVYWYCKNEIKEVSLKTEKKVSQFIQNKSTLPVMNAVAEIKGDISQTCYWYYYETVYGYDYYYCYVYYTKYQAAEDVKLANVKPVKAVEETSYISCSAIGVSALAVGIFVYMKYSKKQLTYKHTTACESETPYKSIL